MKHWFDNGYLFLGMLPRLIRVLCRDMPRKMGVMKVHLITEPASIALLLEVHNVLVLINLLRAEEGGVAVGVWAEILLRAAVGFAHVTLVAAEMDEL